MFFASAPPSRPPTGDGAPWENSWRGVLLGLAALLSSCGSEPGPGAWLAPLETYERNLERSEQVASRIERGPLAAISAHLAGLPVELNQWVTDDARALLPPLAQHQKFSDGTLAVNSVGVAGAPAVWDTSPEPLLTALSQLLTQITPPTKVHRREGELIRFRLAPDGRSASATGRIFLAGWNAAQQRAQVRLECTLSLVLVNNRWKISGLGLAHAEQASTSFPAFRDVTRRTGFTDGMGALNQRLLQAGLDDHRTLALGGLTVLDWNRDGFMDVLATRKGQLTTLLLNDGESGFLPAPHPIQAPLESPALALWLDLDGDGQEELIGSEPLEYEGEKAFLSIWTRTGLDDGQWVRIPRAISLPNKRGLRRLAVQTLVPFDAEGDGDLDLFVAVYGSSKSRGADYNTVEAFDGADNHLLINHGGLAFSEESHERGITGTGYSYVATAFDFDQDGDSDVFEGNDFGPNNLWINDGTGHFKAGTAEGLTGFSAYTMGSSLADYDNEGVWSLYLSNMSSEQGQRMIDLPEKLSASMRQRVRVIAQGNGLHRQGTNGWHDHAQAAGCAEAQWAWGSSFFDPDMDGDLDLLVTNGFASHQNPNHPDWQTYYWRQVLADAQSLEAGERSQDVNQSTKFRGSFNGYEHDCLFWNMDGTDPHGERRFIEAAWLLGLDGDHDGRALAPLDFDGDGDLDMALWTLQGLRLYENLAPSQTVLVIEPRLADSSTPAIGAVVTIEFNDTTRRQPLLLLGGFQTQHEDFLRFATKGAGQTLELHVRWADGTEESWEDVPSCGRLRLIPGRAPVALGSLGAWSETLPASEPEPALDAAGRGLRGLEPVGRPGQPSLILFTQDSTRSLLFADLHESHPDLALCQVALNGEPASPGTAAWPILGMTDELALRFFDQRKPQALTGFAFDANGHWQRSLTSGPLAKDLGPLIALLEEETPFPELSVEAGRRALAEGRFREAQVYFQSALDQDRGRTDAWDGMARTHLAFGRLAKAEECYASAVAADPDYALGHFNLGVARVQVGKLVPALEALEEAIAIDPSNARAHLALAAAAAAHQDSGRARTACLAAALHDPSAEPYLLLTRIALATKDAAGAKEALAQARSREPQHPQLAPLQGRIDELRHR